MKRWIPITFGSMVAICLVYLNEVTSSRKIAPLLTGYRNISASTPTSPSTVGLIQSWQEELKCRATTQDILTCLLQDGMESVYYKIGFLIEDESTQHTGGNAIPPSFCDTADYVFVLREHTLPYHGIRAPVQRAIRELNRMNTHLPTNWETIVIDASTNGAVGHIKSSGVAFTQNTGLPFERVKDDMTGEIFTGPSLVGLRSSFLVNCHSNTNPFNDDLHDHPTLLYLWPPIAGQFPMELWNNLHKKNAIDTADDMGSQHSDQIALHMTMRTKFKDAMDGNILRATFESLRSNIEAWYNDPLVEVRVDVGKFAWPYLIKMFSIISYPHLHGFSQASIANLLPRPKQQGVTQDKVTSRKKNVIKTPHFLKDVLKTILPNADPSDVPFYRHSKYQSADIIKKLKTPGTGETPSSSYAIASFGNNHHREALQMYLWKKENIDINFVKGIDFSDIDEIESHFAMASKGTKFKAPELLVHAHAKATKAMCESGVDVAVVVEDDVYPLPDFEKKLGKQIDVLQEHGQWGYHSISFQYKKSPTQRLHEFKNTPAAFTHYNIGLFKTEPGSLGQAINCERWRWAERTYFLNENGEYITPGEQASRVRERLDVKKTFFTSDNIWMQMFLSDKNDFNTVSNEPLAYLSFLEWATPSELHSDIGKGLKETIKSLETDSVENAIELMRGQDFPTFHLDRENDDATKRYFMKHMWLPRNIVAFRAVFDWTEILAYYVEGDLEAGRQREVIHDMTDLMPDPWNYIPGNSSPDHCPLSDQSIPWQKYIRKWDCPKCHDECVELSGQCHWQ